MFLKHQTLTVQIKLPESDLRLALGATGSLQYLVGDRSSFTVETDHIHYTVLTRKSVTSNTWRRCCFIQDYVGFFPINISPEAEGKISSNPSFMKLFLHISVNILVFKFT
jgi:hypothetical protein